MNDKISLTKNVIYFATSLSRQRSNKHHILCQYRHVERATYCAWLENRLLSVQHCSTSPVDIWSGNDTFVFRHKVPLLHCQNRSVLISLHNTPWGGISKQKFPQSKAGIKGVEIATSNKWHGIFAFIVENPHGIFHSFNTKLWLHVGHNFFRRPNAHISKKRRLCFGLKYCWKSQLISHWIFSISSTIARNRRLLLKEKSFSRNISSWQRERDEGEISYSKLLLTNTRP